MDQTVPYGTDSFFDLFQAVNCLATIILFLRDKSHPARHKICPVITQTARGTHDLFEFVTVFFFAFIGPFSQNHFRLRVRIKRQVLPMGCGMSDNKDWRGRWRRDRSSNRTLIVTTKSRLLRNFSRRCYTHPSTRTKKPTLQHSSTPPLQYSVLQLSLSSVSPTLQYCSARGAA
jgi:hypothetical protein